MWESEDRYRTLFDLCPVAVYSCDAAGVIEKFNRRAAELWGREPAPGDTDERFCGSFKLFRPGRQFHASRAVSDGRGGERQIRGGARRGSAHRAARWLAGYGGREHPAAEEPQGEVTAPSIASTTSPSANRPRSNCERPTSNWPTSDRRKSDFLAMLSHELRNPLATIRAGLQVMRLTDAPAVNLP